MLETWRWFGPVDRVSVPDALQAGAQAIVSALHHVPTGSVWTKEEISRRQEETRAGGLEWKVVESLPVSEAIKTGGKEMGAHIAAWKRSLENLAACGLTTVCYNFMPVLDWTRTDLYWRTSRGARAMRFDLIDFAVFDIHILGREHASRDYGDEVTDGALRRHRELDETARRDLTSNIGAGLPGTGSGGGGWAMRRSRTSRTAAMI